MEDLEMEKPDGTTVSMFVDEKILESSVHEELDCADCHEDLTAEHPDDEIPAKPVNCAECHEEQPRSTPPASTGEPEWASPPAPVHDCHGKHDMLGSDNPNSPTLSSTSPHLRQVPRQPGMHRRVPDEIPGCRQPFPRQHPRPGAAQDGPRRRPLLQRLPRRPRHQAQRSTADSPVNKANIAETCGKCHVGVEEIYNKSVHGQLLLEGDPTARSAPTATPPTRSRRTATPTSSRPATRAAASATRTA